MHITQASTTTASTTMPAGDIARMAPVQQLSRRQVGLLVGWAIVLWFLAAMFIRYAPAALFARGTATAVLFASALPVGLLAVRATRRIASLTPHQLVAGVALCSATAMLCDGIAFTWSTLYGSAGVDLVPGAAWLLWGVGLILVLAVVIAFREDA